MYSCDGCGRGFPNREALDLHKERYCSSGATGATELRVPEADPYYFISDTDLREVRRIIALAEERPENLAIIGPYGSGKTSMALQIAALRRSPCYLANSYAARSADEWFGQERLGPTGTYYVPSLFVQAVETPGATVIINDLALMQNRAVQNGLNDLLDYNVREAWVDSIVSTLGRPVRVADGVLIIATWNEGVEYTGNVRLSANLLDRFPNRIYLDYPPNEVMSRAIQMKTGLRAEEAVRLVEYAEILRNLDQPIHISMRGLLQAARKMVLGATLYDSLLYTVIGGLSPGDSTKALAAMEKVLTVEEKRCIARPRWRAWQEAIQ